eukprot:2121734-Rhodomonas_salina.7
MSGHMQVQTVDGVHYFLLVLDDATGYNFVALLRTKDAFIFALRSASSQPLAHCLSIQPRSSPTLESYTAYSRIRRSTPYPEACQRHAAAD